MKKLLIISLFGLFSFNVFAESVISLTPEQLCKEYQNGNSSLVLKKYKGKKIKDTGVISVNYNEAGMYTAAFFSLSTKLKINKNIIYLKGFKDATPKNDNEYTSLDGKTKTIYVKIDDIELDNMFGDSRCRITGELLEVN